MHARERDDLEARIGAALRRLREVRLAYLFGSHSRGQARPESDIDVAVLVTDAAAAAPRATLARLFDHLGRVVPSQRLDVVLLNRAPSLLRHRVVSGGTPVLARDARERVRFVADAIRDHQDMQVRRGVFYRRRLERISRGESDGGSGDFLAQARGVARLLGQAESLSRDD